MSDYDDVADPELLARLSAWFGGGEPVVSKTPSFTPPQPNPRLAEIEKVIDHELRVRLESQPNRDPTQFEQRIDVVIDDSLPVFTAPPEPPDQDDLEYWQPDDIEEALAEENTPQSVLRDLFRPVTHFHLVLQPPDDADEGDGVEQIRQAVREPVRPELAPLPPELIAADLAELRDILAQPWEDAKPEEVSETVNLSGPDAFWFGAQGGYDPDL